jgi:hypothetical protein
MKGMKIRYPPTGIWCEQMRKENSKDSKMNPSWNYQDLIHRMMLFSPQMS